MSESSKAFGLTKDVLQKIEAKYDLGMEKECMEWIEAVTGRSFYTGKGHHFMTTALKDGVILCELMNKVQPGSIKKINTSSLAFKQMENIESFLSACRTYGVSTHELFQTVDLYEQKNPTQVLITVHAFGRRATTKKASCPPLGPREAERHERHFTEEQLREGEGIIGLQMGSNKGASQSGQSFGKRRDIID